MIRSDVHSVPPSQRQLVIVDCPDGGGATVSVINVFVEEFLYVRAGQDLAELRIGECTDWVTAPVNGEVASAQVRVGHSPPAVLFRLRSG